MCTDLIGPYKIKRKGQPDLICKCITLIDPASGWFELHQYNDKRAITVANVGVQEWFARYPWPTHITFDRANELHGHEFEHMILHDYGIKCKSMTVRKPQANTIVEQIDQVIEKIIRTYNLESNYLNKDNP